MLDSVTNPHWPTAHRLQQQSKLDVTLRYSPDCVDWARPLACAIAQHPRMHLSCRQLPASSAVPADLHSPIPGLVARFLDTPRFGQPDSERQPMTDSGEGAMPKVLIDCCVGRPESDRGTAVHHWHIDPVRIEADADAALLAGMELAPLILSGVGMDGKQHIVGTHALPVQAYAPSDRRNAARGALPLLCLSVLIRIANDRPLRKPDLTLVAEITRIHQLSRRGLWWRSSSLLLRRLRTQLSGRFTREHWELAVLPEANPSVDTLLERPIENYKPVFSNDDRTLRADPHALITDEGVRVWYEAMSASDQRADIRSVLLGQKVDTSREISVLHEHHHFSYPFVFTHDGAHWMIPETGEVQHIELRRHDPDTNQWPVVKVLIENINATDTTVLHHRGKWWMFTNLISHPVVDERDLLLIFHAETLDGDWLPHRLNPVLTGVDKARMAGPLFHDGEALIRPSQYGGVRYGHGINLARVETLTEDDYEETHLGRILPSARGPWLGCHTLHVGTGMTLIDRMRQRR